MGAKLKALIADDDESILFVLEGLLSEKGIEAERAVNGVEAAAALKSGRAGIALIDINMPGKDGLTVLKEAKEAGADTPVIIMTAESTMANTFEAMRLGAFDYISKPFDISEVEIAVERASEERLLRSRVAALSERLKERLEAESVFVGRSKAVQGVFKTLGKVSSKDVTVLILGESGTGKELLARIIHANSLRSEGPFIAVNSAAIPKDLLESELFGYEKGAFTGAAESKKGKFELADGGTLFLDEIGDMSLDAQARLLRAIQEREFYKVGGREPVRVDVRIIAATNHDLEKEASEKAFREDLLFRLNGVTVKLPPLRERKGDIAVLTEFFMGRCSSEFGGGPKTLSPEAREALEQYHWPGNVRELENVLRRAFILSPSVNIGASDLDLPQSRARKESLEEVISARLKPFIDKTSGRGNQHLYDFIMPFMERPLLKLVLEKTRGNQLQAAEMLGINRNTLRKKIKDLAIDPGEYKG